MCYTIPRMVPNGPDINKRYLFYEYSVDAFIPWIPNAIFEKSQLLVPAKG